MPFSGKELTSHSVSLSKLAYRLTRNRTEAEDLIQDTYLKAIDKQAAFDGGNLGAWLVVMMRHIFLNKVRSRKVKQNHLQIVDLDIDNSFARGVPAQQETALFMSDLKKATARVKPKYLKVFDLVVTEGLSYEEASIKLEIPVGSAKNRVHRVKAEIIQYMER